jgi:hypothetical protein
MIIISLRNCGSCSEIQMILKERPLEEANFSIQFLDFVPDKVELMSVSNNECTRIGLFQDKERNNSHFFLINKL